MIIEPCKFWTNKVGVYSTPCPIDVSRDGQECNIYRFDNFNITLSSDGWARSGSTDDRDAKARLNIICDDTTWSASKYVIYDPQERVQFIGNIVFRELNDTTGLYEYKFEVDGGFIDSVALPRSMKVFFNANGTEVVVSYLSTVGQGPTYVNFNFYENTGVGLNFKGNHQLNKDALADLDPNNVIPTDYTAVSLVDLDLLDMGSDLSQVCIAVNVDYPTMLSGTSDVDVFIYDVDFGVSLTLVKDIPAYYHEGTAANLLDKLAVSSNGKYVTLTAVGA